MEVPIINWMQKLVLYETKAVRSHYVFVVKIFLKINTVHQVSMNSQLVQTNKLVFEK